MRRYADQQLALMTGQVDIAPIGYVNVGLMEEKISETIASYPVSSRAAKV